MFRNLLIVLLFMLLLSCVNNNRTTSIVVDSSKDTISVCSTDSVLIVRLVYHDTVYVRNSQKSVTASKTNQKNLSCKDPFTEPLPKFDDE